MPGTAKSPICQMANACRRDAFKIMGTTGIIRALMRVGFIHDATKDPHDVLTDDYAICDPHAAGAIMCNFCDDGVGAGAMADPGLGSRS